MRPRFSFVACLLVVLCAAARASAGTIVLESHVGERSRGAAEILAPLYDELGNREVQRSYPEVGQRFETLASRPSQVGAGLPAGFTDQLERGYKLWITGQFQPCVAALQPLVDEAHRNPAQVSSNPRLGAAVHKGLVGLSLCHQRLGDSKSARATMLELLRSFDAEVSKGQFGSEAYDLFINVRTEARTGSLGSLTVRSTDETAAIFFNERFVKLGEAARVDLIPGTYRVFAQLGKSQGRVHIVEIKPSVPMTLELDPVFERTVVTTPEWSGLAFRDKAERDRHEPSYAARFGVAVAAMSVIVVGIDTRNGRSIAYGALIHSATGKEQRRASVVLDNVSPPERLRALARFLTGDQPADGLEVQLSPNAAVIATAQAGRSGARSSHNSVWKWAATAGAVSALGAGVTLLVLDGSCTEDPPRGQVCPDLRDLSTAGYITLGAGVALGAVATLLWLGERSPSRSESALWVMPGDGGAVAGISLPL